MDRYYFKKAIAVWPKKMSQPYNQLVGFFHRMDLPERTQLLIAVAANSYYRLFLNGEFVSSGPARTAEGYCRVDEINVTREGPVQLAVEVLALNTPERYSNDCTMEPGMLALEVSDRFGHVLSATGCNHWICGELPYRRMETELMSHSRGIAEYYDMTCGSQDWITGVCEGFEEPAVIKEPIYLHRRAPYPDYHRIGMKYFLEAGDCVENPSAEMEASFHLSRLVHPKWYSMVPAENCFQRQILSETDAPFTGEMTAAEIDGRVTVQGGRNPAYLLWGNEASDLGFPCICLEMEQDGAVDLICSDHKEITGEVRADAYAVRYRLCKGTHRLLSWEPKLTRYVKLILRTSGKVTVQPPVLLCDTYRDRNACYFECNDNDVNRIYQAAKRTLRMNTLDIFMDCPQRERGGWLCDSFFTARGAWQMFGDLRVERDFLENFMLTDPDVLWHSYFPEVYPRCQRDPSRVGIANWSYWLAEELYEYDRRSGDREFVEKCRYRMTRFVEGMLALRGESGLLEHIPVQFVDWSISNAPFNLEPISLANNCLAVDALEKLAELYRVDEWKTAAAEMREVLERAAPGYFSKGDAASYADGKLVRQGCATESAAALEIWSGFHRGDKAFLRNFVKAMGPCPQYRPDPNIGRSNLFIGLMIRFDALSKLNQPEVLLNELREVYLPELRDGSGTLFENYHELSGCHGFNAAAGALLMSDILGLGQPHQKDQTILLKPAPCGLLWASGAEQCADGPIFMKWHADYEEHLLDMTVSVPKGWRYDVQLPFGLNGWTVKINQTIYQKGVE